MKNHHLPAAQLRPAGLETQEVHSVWNGRAAVIDSVPLQRCPAFRKDAGLDMPDEPPEGSCRSRSDSGPWPARSRGPARQSGSGAGRRPRRRPGAKARQDREKRFERRPGDSCGLPGPPAMARACRARRWDLSAAREASERIARSEAGVAVKSNPADAGPATTPPLAGPRDVVRVGRRWPPPVVLFVADPGPIQRLPLYPLVHPPRQGQKP